MKIDLTNLSIIKGLLRTQGIRPNKRLGQHFLIDKKVLEQIVEAAEITKEDTVIEIGPGLGVLTQELCEVAGEVFAVEKDDMLFEILLSTCGQYENLTPIVGDILDLELKKIEVKDFNNGYKVVSNLPYQITSPVIRKFLSPGSNANELVLLIQKEVAERITAPAGSAGRGYLTVLVEFYGDAEIVFNVSKKCFWPEPAVESAVIKIKRKEQIPDVDEKEFFRLVQAGFSRKRKQLINTISSGLVISKEGTKNILDKAGIDSTRRAETLTLDEWLNILKMRN